MEYATEPNGSNWIECGGDEVTGLSAGTYYVRYKRTTDKPASAVATVVVPAYSGGGEIVPPTPDNPGTIVIIRPAEEEKPAQQPNPSTGANDLVGLASPLPSPLPSPQPSAPPPSCASMINCPTKSSSRGSFL